MSEDKGIFTNLLLQRLEKEEWRAHKSRIGFLEMTENELNFVQIIELFKKV